MSAVAPPASRAVAARRARKRRTVRTGWNLVGLAVLVIMVFPVYWMISTAFKPDDEVNSLKPTWFPLGATFSHFRQAISGADHPFFWNSVVNSLIIVGVTVAVSIALAFLAAVALAKFRFTGRKVFIVLMIGIQMLPQTGLIIPLYVSAELQPDAGPVRPDRRDHHLHDVRAAVLGLDAARLPARIPRELEEAAMVDGSSRLGAFVRILLPLVAPGLVATSVFAFITSWNEYIFANVLLQDQSKQTLTVWLSYFAGSARHTDWAR